RLRRRRRRDEGRRDQWGGRSRRHAAHHRLHLRRGRPCHRHGRLGGRLHAADDDDGRPAGPADRTTLNYDYDAAGNLTRAGSTTYGYDERDRLTSSTSSGSTTTYAYTPRGTLTSAGTTTYTADAFDQTVSAATPGGSFSYTYDALGRLATRGPATFAYSGFGNIVTADGTATYSHDAAGGLLGINQAGTATLAVTDQHDDLVATANPATGALAGSVAYSPLGVVTATVGTQRSLGYQSGWTDPATGAVNMLSRWYSPGTGAFTSRDTVANSPVGHSVDANRYTYGNGSPLDVTDPTGHGGCKWVWRWDSTSRTYTYQFVCGGETGTRGRPQLGGDDRPGVTYGPDNPGRYCYVLGLGCGGRYVSPWQDGAQHGAARYRSPSSSHRSGPRGSGGGGGGSFASPYRCLSECGGLASRPRPARPLPPQDPCAHGRHCTVPKLPPVKPQFSPVKDKTRPDQLAKGTPTVIGGAATTGTTGQPTTCDDTAICAGTGLTPGQLPGNTGLPGTAACAPDNTISYASLSTALTPTCPTTPGNAAPPNGDINININVPAPNLGDTAGDPIPEPAAPPLNINVPAENLGTHINYSAGDKEEPSESVRTQNDVDIVGTPADEAPEHLFHYTDAAGRAAIQRSGSIRPIAEGEGSIFLTSGEYVSSAEAQSKLAMTRVRPTGYFKIPIDRIANLEGPSTVRAWPPGSTSGGGAEYWTQTPIDVTDIPWTGIGP
ncbi:MAG TPA: RHS repeat-associated core domain-containing protein, partial [Streptosporangiaceae bacterium]